MNKSLGWTINRLRCMSAAEILHRVAVKAQTIYEARGFGLAMSAPAPLSLNTARWIPDPQGHAAPERYLERANRVLEGRFDVFALKDADLGFPPRWNRDPKTGRDAPLGFGKTLNYRDELIAGDIKYLWEINRHRELLWLAQAWALSREPSYLHGISVLIRSWLDQCPYPRGVNWTSSLEHAVRLIHWSAVWSLIGGTDSPLFAAHDGESLRRAWLDSVYQHSHFIAGHFSRHSSANNHLIGEYAGLFVAASVWPLWPESEEWKTRASRGLEAEIGRQTFTDGFNREQATWYHHEVAELFLICGLVAKQTGYTFSTDYWKGIEGMLDAIALLMDCAGNVPAIGDADDAVYLELGLDRDVYKSLMSTAAVVFDRPDFKAKLTAFDERSSWLLGNDACERFGQIEAESVNPVMPAALPDAGYYILGCSLDTQQEVRVLLDAGSLGYLSIAAHGHADALALLLSVGGAPVFIDPGTFAYHTEEKWRCYFRSTAAHNTVTIDGQDQSVQAGNFMWLEHAQAQCLRCEQVGQEQIWEGEHAGYKRLSDPVVHKRQVILNEDTAVLTVKDFLRCEQAHEVAVHWHVHPDCEVSLTGNTATVKRGGATVLVSMPDCDWVPELLEGEEEPPMGWLSESFDEKVPTTTLRFSGGIKGSFSLATRIEISGSL